MTSSATTTSTSSRRLFQLASEESWEPLESLLQDLNDDETDAGDENNINDNKKSSSSSSSTAILEEQYGDLAPDPIPSDSSLLHLVCSFPSVSPSIVNLLIKKVPALVTRQDGLGRNPLHVALMEGSCQPSIVRLLAQTAPEAVQQRDYSYSTPIEVLTQVILMQEERSKYANRHQQSSTADAVAIRQEKMELKSKLDRLWDCVRPLAVASCHYQYRDWDNSPMLHSCLRACSSHGSGGIPFALMERARKRYEDQLSLPDSLGDYPLHILAGWDPEEDTEDYLGTFAKKFPRAAKTVNHHEELPLDVALQSGMRGWDTGVAQLLEIYPASDRWSMGECSHLLGRAARQQRKTLIFEILRNQPEFFTLPCGQSSLDT